MLDNQPFVENKDAGTLAQAIVDTVREPLLVLDQDQRVLAASRSFYQAFKVAPSSTQGQLLYALGHGQWDIPGLRLLLEKIVPEHSAMEDYEVEHQFPEIGKRTMLLNARKVFYEGNSHTTILLGIEDVTTRRALEREREELLQKQQALLSEKDVLLEELEHRVGNSLQIIAAIILMKSRMVKSEETRHELQDTHNRVMSVAAVQRHLHVSGATGPIAMAPYLTMLCESLKSSMISEDHAATLKVTSDAGSVTSREAVSLGLIVTELILNALKHAFPHDRADRQITPPWPGPSAGPTQESLSPDSAAYEPKMSPSIPLGCTSPHYSAHWPSRRSNRRFGVTGLRFAASRARLFVAGGGPACGLERVCGLTGMVGCPGRRAPPVT